MITKISNKISLLSTSSKILVIGSLENNLTLTIDKYFEHKEYLTFNLNTLNILNESLFEQFDIVIFSFGKEEFEILNKSSIKIPKNSICIICDDIYLDFKVYINEINSILLNPVEEDSLLDKIYSILSFNELENLLKTKKKVINKYKSEHINEDIDIFLDKYSGEIMFINEDLTVDLEALKNLDMSKEVFSNISASLIKLANVMRKNINLDHLGTLFFEFSQFLDAIEIDKIEPSKYSAFDYLSHIIEDLTLYIDELFVYRLFKDVKVFEDSMSNNISYFEAELYGLEIDSNSDNLEFF